MSQETQPHLPAAQPAELHPPDSAVGPGYEVRDTNVNAVALFIVGMFVVLVISQFAMWGLLNAFSGGKPEPADGLNTPAVILEQKRKLTADEDAILGGTEPTGEKADASRISITDAIDRIARDGIPRVADRPRTEIEVNSHSGTPAAATAPAPATETDTTKGAKK